MFVDLQRRYAAARLLGLRVRIPLTAFVFVPCICCVGSGLCNGLITRPEESSRECVFLCVCVCVCI